MRANHGTHTWSGHWNLFSFDFANFNFQSQLSTLNSHRSSTLENSAQKSWTIQKMIMNRQSVSLKSMQQLQTLVPKFVNPSNIQLATTSAIPSGCEIVRQENSAMRTWKKSSAEITLTLGLKGYHGIFHPNVIEWIKRQTVVVRVEEDACVEYFKSVCRENKFTR